uniref:Uncharacterized protein n=1 Tax=uncultured bacterium contig00055 TaxID=1181539 RepID=A0A806KJX0_9BACT|nr:hypothetical protein [uncultured bacterium contig00055]
MIGQLMPTMPAFSLSGLEGELINEMRVMGVTNIRLGNFVL